MKNSQSNKYVAAKKRQNRRARIEQKEEKKRSKQKAV